MNHILYLPFMWQSAGPWTQHSIRGVYTVCEVGGPAMVGSEEPGRILKFGPPRLAKTALSSWKKNGIIFPVKHVKFSAQDILSTQK